jgi:Flp pilus assembly protein TadG
MGGRRLGRGSDDGQAIVFFVVGLLLLLGCAAFVVDVGSWYWTQRKMQSQVDASALAGAQALPDTETASALAEQYGSKNGVTIPIGAVTFSGVASPDDSITVKLREAAPGFFSRVFGFNTVQISVQATAQSRLLGEARYVAPITVSKDQPMLGGPGCPCFGQATSIPLDRIGAPGAFGLLNLDGSHGGNGGPGTLADWILNGYDGYLGLGPYWSNTGAKFNASQIQSALTQRIGSELLFPVYDSLTGNGANAQYDIIGWVGFRLTGFDARGSSGELYGSFVSVEWNGLAAPSGGGEPNFGARTVTLTR